MEPRRFIACARNWLVIVLLGIPSYSQHVGDEKLILMTSTFDVLTESPLHPDDFGEGS